VVVANRTTASADQYELDTGINLLENSSVAIKILKQDPLRETVVVLGSRAEGCALITNNTISFKISKKAAIVNPLVKKEPEELRDQACGALALKETSELTVDDTSFSRSNCEGGDDDTRNFEPEEVATQTVAIIGAAGRQLANIRSRLDRLRATKGQRDVDVSAASLNIQGATVSVGLLGGAAGDDENGLLENSRWGFFANGDYAFGNENRGNDGAKKGGDRNFDFNSTGLTFGADYRFPGEKMIAGAALGYKDFDSDFTTQKGGTSVKGYNLSVYGAYLLSDKAYMDATIGLGNNKLDSRRPVNNDGTRGIGNQSTFAIGKPDAAEFTFSVGGGYEFYKGEWSLTPYGRMDYIKGTVDAYTELASHTSARTSMFKIDKQNIESLTSTLGVKASRVVSTSKGVFIPYASLDWKHDFKGRGSISGSSIYLNEAFEERNRSEFDRNYYNLGLGVSAQFPKGKSAFLSLESRQGDSVVEDTTIRAGIRLEF
jgi:outer membrane autotransporter protein